MVQRLALAHGGSALDGGKEIRDEAYERSSSQRCNVNMRRELVAVEQGLHSIVALRPIDDVYAVVLLHLLVDTRVALVAAGAALRRVD